MSSGGGPSGDARAAVRELGARYERARVEDFFAGVDSSEYPNFDSFRDKVRQFFLRNRQITMDLRVDMVNAEGERVSVEIHWNKSYVNAEGQPRLEEGACELMFRKRSSGGYALTSIRGASPF